MNKFDWRTEKVTLRATLNTCLRHNMSYEETEQALQSQFAASCTVCVIKTLGQCTCDHGRQCFIEQALSKYLDVARNKCDNKEERL